MTEHELSVLKKDANLAHAQGRLSDARLAYRRLLDFDDGSPLIWHKLGILELQEGNLPAAVECFRKTLGINPNQSDALSNLSYCYSLVGRHEDALAFAEKAIALDATNDAAYTNLGKAYQSLGNYDSALDAYRNAEKLEGTNPRNKYNIATVLVQQKKLDEALVIYKQLINQNIVFPQLYGNLSAIYLKQSDFSKSLDAADRALELDRSYTDAWINRGIALREMRRDSDALDSFNIAQTKAPNTPEVYLYRAKCESNLELYEKAAESYKKCLAYDPKNAVAWRDYGSLLTQRKDLEGALECYEKAYAIKQETEYVLGNLLHTQMKMCKWDQFEDRVTSLKRYLTDGVLVSHGFPLLGLIDDPMLHKIANEKYAEKFPRLGETKSTRGKKKQRIRIGYYSADFHNHATSYLIVEIFELHDKKQFDIFCFSFGPNDNSAMRDRIRNSSTEFFDVAKKSDDEIVDLSKKLEIDIAVDLKGYTEHSRPRIFARRAAPIQCNYLGYPSTMGANFIDYIIADETVLPAREFRFFNEKVVLLPDCYQPNDGKKIRPKRPAKSELGELSQNCFVYCCFNNNWKILPETFDLWMKILNQVEGSVLWLLEDNAHVAKNLRNEASKRTVSPERIVFSKRAPLAEYLQRYHFADLFLDTSPYNAHTTASDSLWMGVPVLTLEGNSFAGRVGASLLRSVGLPELVSKTTKEYEEKAVELGKSSLKIAELKQKLRTNIESTALFDSQRYVKNLEKAFSIMHEQMAYGRLPENIRL